MKLLITNFLLLIAFGFNMNAQCLINFNPNQIGDELLIDGQGVNQTITASTTVNFNGTGSITFTYSGSSGSSFNYDCDGISFSSGAINDGFQHFEANPLPVELTFFRAEIIENKSVLTWQTSSEENNSGFEVERSTDGENFETIGFVEGNGTTLEVQNYTYIDNNPTNGINYYRLRQVDFDGAFEYSDVVNVELEKETVENRIVQNPVFNELRLNGSGIVIIYNSLGQPIDELQLTESDTLTVNVSSYSKGLYYARFGNKTLQFVKL